MAKQANGVPASAKAGGAVAPGRRTTGAPPAIPASRSRKVARQPRSDKVKAAAKEAKPAGNPKPAPPALSEEEQIGSAKYLPRELPPRVFEEERFIFPETYGVNRVRLLVKDPHWLFAHWDVDPRVREKLRGEKGERVAALARLTLRLTDDHGGIGGAIVLPEGARSWYLRAVPGHRSYRVELGITLPSGEYRGLTRSNAVSTPHMGPSPEKATRRASYRLAAKNPPLSTAGPGMAGPGGESETAPRRKAAKGATGAGPAGRSSRTEPVAGTEPSPGPEPGGASDLFRR
jgi:Domain of unknown function (DUF4912)